MSPPCYFPDSSLKDDPRCALCHGAVGEGNKSFSSAKMLRPPNDFRLPVNFNETERVLLGCRHVAHAACLVTTARRERIFFLRRFFQTIDAYNGGVDPEDNRDARQLEISNAWYSGCQPYVNCRICGAEWESLPGTIASLTRDYPPSRLEITGSYAPMSDYESMSFLSIFHDAIMDTAPVAVPRRRWTRTIHTSPVREEPEGTGEPNTTTEPTTRGEPNHSEPTTSRPERVRRSVRSRSPTPVSFEVFKKRMRTGRRI